MVVFGPTSALPPRIRPPRPDAGRLAFFLRLSTPAVSSIRIATRVCPWLGARGPILSSARGLGGPRAASSQALLSPSSRKRSGVFNHRHRAQPARTEFTRHQRRLPFCLSPAAPAPSTCHEHLVHTRFQAVPPGGRLHRHRWRGHSLAIFGRAAGPRRRRSRIGEPQRPGRRPGNRSPGRGNCNRAHRSGARPDPRSVRSAGSNVFKHRREGPDRPSRRSWSCRPTWSRG